MSYGAALAIAVSIAFGALLTFTSTSILQSFESREIFGGTLSIVAVGFVTWMVFWMRRTARGMSSELGGRLGSAIEVGSVAVVLTAFLAVAREGLETALFFWSAVQAAGTTTTPMIGFTLDRDRAGGGHNVLVANYASSSLRIFDMSAVALNRTPDSSYGTQLRAPGAFLF